MNTPASSPAVTARRGLHPLVAIASVCVIALCAVAIAAILGWLPTPKAQQEAAQSATAAAPQAGAVQGAAPVAQPAPAPMPARADQVAAGQAATGQAATGQVGTNQVGTNQVGPGQAPGAGSQAACPHCGVVVSVNTVQVPVQNRSEPILGTVAGGVVGGVVGNQFGGGNGRTAMTVLGAVGGALAGREIERNMKQQQTVTQYRLVARTNDGRTHTFRSSTPFQYAPGQAIRVENNQLLPQ